MNRCLKRFLFLGVLVPILFIASAYTADFKDAQFTHVEYPDWFHKDPFIDLAEATAEAKSSGKEGLMVLFSTEGCSYCGAFIQKSLGNPEIAARVQKHFVSVGLEIFDDAEMTAPYDEETSVKEFAEQEKAGFSPTLVFYDTDGKRTLTVVGYQSSERFTRILDYTITKKYQNETLAGYFARNSVKDSTAGSASMLKEDALFSEPPFALDRSLFPASQPLMVLFEETGCLDCDDFHSKVLALSDVRETLKRFEIVRLDARDDRMAVIAPDGRGVTPASWFQEIGFARVPAMIFFDEKGNQVLSTDALVKHQRMMNSLNYVLERAYIKGWTYQRFARSKAIERNLQKRKSEN